MTKEKYKDINLQSLIDDIGNGWKSDDDIKVHKATASFNMSSAQKGKPVTEERKATLIKANIIAVAVNKNRVISAEEKERKRLSRVGKKVSIETRMKQSLAGKGRNKTPEHAAKIGLANTGRPISEKTLLAFAKYRENRIFSKETREKMSLSRIGKKRSEETIAKIKEISLAKKLAIPVTYKGVTYENIVEASKILNTKEALLRTNIIRDKKRIATGLDVKVEKRKKEVELLIIDVKYKSIGEASKILKITKSIILHRLNSKLHPKWHYVIPREKS